MSTIKILLVDDHKIVREGLKLYFLDHPDYEVTQEASNGIEALDILASHPVDLVITDVSMPEMDGTELTRNIKKLYPEIPVLALTMISEASIVKNLIEIGVNGYILKDCEEEEVFKALKQLDLGKNYYSDVVQEAAQKKDQLIS